MRSRAHGMRQHLLHTRILPVILLSILRHVRATPLPSSALQSPPCAHTAHRQPGPRPPPAPPCSDTRSAARAIISHDSRETNTSSASSESKANRERRTQIMALARWLSLALTDFRIRQNFREVPFDYMTFCRRRIQLRHRLRPLPARSLPADASRHVRIVAPFAFIGPSTTAARAARREGEAGALVSRRGGRGAPLGEHWTSMRWVGRCLTAAKAVVRCQVS